MSDKKFTPAEAAIAVLKKAEEMYKNSTLAKGDWAKIHSKLKKEGYSEKSADKIDGAIKAKMGKSEDPMKKMGMSEQNPDAKADADLGEKVEQDVQQHEATNQDPKHHEKGSYKLAKFMGKMEMKKGSKAKEMDKGEDPLNPIAGDRAKRAVGYGKSGDGIGEMIAKEGSKDAHKERLEGIKAQPKPKLPG
jgi:hypothetical protein